MEYAHRFDLFPEPGLALLAVSGGSDSVALLDLMAGAGVASALGIEAVVGHVDHGIHAASARVAEAVAQLATRYGLACHAQALRLGPAASETRARRERYAALRRIQGEIGARYLVTAHQADDQIETVLLRLLRGSGPAGLAGIRPAGPGGLVRPLLFARRSELFEWVTSRGLEPFDDPANRDERHDRVWVRRRLLPLLAERFGAELPERLLAASEHAACERKAWGSVLRTLSELGYHEGRGFVEVARKPLVRYDNVLSEALLRALCRELGHVLSRRHAGDLLRFLERGQSGQVLVLGGDVRAELVFDRLRVVRGAPPSGALPVRLGESQSGCVVWGRWQFRWLAEPAGQVVRAGWETWVPQREAEIRALGPGDRMVPLGGIGRRPVRRLLMEARVPRAERGAYPVLVIGGRVVWVPGICRGAAEVPSPGGPAWRVVAVPPTGGTRD